MPDAENTMRPTAGRFAKNALFAIASRWVIRIIGLISVTIMARILAPQDFGLFSIAFSAIALAEVLTYVGVRTALISHPDPGRGDYDTAWTINFIANAVLAIATFVFIAPLAAGFFGRDELLPLIRVLSLRFVFNGLVNIGIVDFERNLVFKRDFYMRSLARVLTFAVTIGTALYLRNYWALAVGSVAMGASLTVCSYAMHDYRPRFCLTHWRRYFEFSLWMLVGAAAAVVLNQIERIALGRVADTVLTGLYATSQDLIRIFTVELVMGVSRVTLPSFARLSTDQSAFGQHVATAFGGYALIAVPFALGMSATAESFVLVLLGNQWIDAAPLLSILAIAGGLRSMADPLGPILLAKQQYRSHAIINVVFAVLFVALVVGVARRADATAIAQSVIAANLALLFGTFVIIARKFGVNILALVYAVARPSLAGAAMYGVVTGLPISADWPTIAELTARVAVGGAVYPVFLLSIWFLSGRPEGAEATLLREVRQRLHWR